MYENIFEAIRHAAEKRNLRERTIQLYCNNVSYFLRCTNKPVNALTLEDADAFLTRKRLEGRSPVFLPMSYFYILSCIYLMFLINNFSHNS